VFREALERGGGECHENLSIASSHFPERRRFVAMFVLEVPCF
jgi:hypothetical protein